MASSNPAIVVVAFNRARSLNRLLYSLEKAYYPNDSITLIISIDKGPNNEDVVSIAQGYHWNYGTKKVVVQNKNLGLRTHVLQCGDYTKEFDSIIMLEDDLYVSPNFYYYSVQALDFSIGKKAIGGVSLYNHQLNVHTNKNFQPIQDGFDNWYFQFASSWGQAWTSNQWNEFRTWYDDGPSIDDDMHIPEYVRSWSEKSWLKYFIAFLIIKNRWFIYPKISLTTNFSDAGTHVGEDSTVFQLPLLYNLKKHYSFSTIRESGAVYDAFYENMKIGEVLQFKDEELCVDLYGYRALDGVKKRYFLTTQILNYKILESFGCSLKPMDSNILQGVTGNDIYLYDLNSQENGQHVKDDKYRRIIYNFKLISLDQAISVAYRLLKEKLKRVIGRIFK